jgi:hypothetical protein
MTQHMTAPPTPVLFKVLDTDGMPYHGGRGGAYVVGKKLAVRGPLEACRNGIHVCTERQLVQWLGPAIYPVIDASEERIDAGDKTVVRWVVLGDPFVTWNERTMRLFACDCAERVLPIFEKKYQNDPRPRNAIVTTRRLANGDGTKEEWAAVDAAWAAAWDAWATAWDAAGAAAGAARNAAGAAAGAARNAAWAAAGAARDAAWAAAGDAAWAAAGDGDGDAAWAAEQAWQTDRLLRYLRGDIS